MPLIPNTRWVFLPHVPNQDGPQLQSPAPFLTLGTRGSPLALKQAELVQRLLVDHHQVPLTAIPIEVIRTEGDSTQSANISLKDIGGKGLFSKEIETALADRRIDVGVHSAKDMATNLPDGLTMPAYLEREPVCDAFISLIANSIDDLPRGARIGTSSLRRAAQMRHRRPDLEVVEFRGNVAKRLEKLKDGLADATLLALAGLNRLGMAEHATSTLDPLLFPPAPAQGAIGLECRDDDTATRQKIAPLNHTATFTAIIAERAMLRTLDGSCRTPIGVLTVEKAGQLILNAQVLSPDGVDMFTGTIIGPTNNAEALGDQLGQSLINQAGEAFFVKLRQQVAQ